MEKEMYVAVLVVIAMFACVVHGCGNLEAGARHPEHIESDQRKIYYSSVVVYGEILQQVSGKRYPNRGVKGVSNVKFNVSCVYLGDDIPSIIYIAGMGNLKGQLPNCPPAPVDMTAKTIMFLKKTADPEIFEVEFKPNYGEPSIILDDLTINCGLTLDGEKYPLCADFIPMTVEEECVQYTTTTTKAPPTTNAPVIVDNNDTGNKQKDEPGYEVKGDDNVEASKDNANPDRMTVESDGGSKGGAATHTGSLVACLSTLFLILLRVL